VTAAPTELWTTRKLLLWMRQAFTKKGLESPGLMSEILLAHVLGCERLKLHMEADRPASPLERETLRSLVQRALNHEPVQYLTGEGWFYGLPFKVDRRVLIPRSSTSTIIDEILHHARATPGFGGPTGPNAGEGVFIADICTGSGCIAVTLLKQLAKARAVATDISAEALEVAAENAKRHNVADRLDLLQGDLLAALDKHAVARTEGSLHYLVSNPPYIPDHEWDAVEPNVKNHEPSLALRGGKDGLDLVRRVFADGVRFLRPGGLIAVEIAASTGKQTLELARATPGLVDARLVRDLEGHDRVVVATRES
jgi:release factor glutamine methyltransferase